MPDRILNDENVNALISMATGALENPNQRPQLMAQLEGVTEDIKANGDADALAFIMGLRQVAAGGLEVVPDVEVPAAYRQPWNAMLAYLQRADLPEPQDAFTTIARNTILVMTEAPQHKQSWFENVAQNRQKAEEAGDIQMVALLDGIHTLLLEGKAPPTPPMLLGAHRACWDRIVAAVE